MTNVEKAQIALEKNFVINLHDDLLCDVIYRHKLGEQKVIERLYLPKIKAAKFDAVILSLFVDDLFTPTMTLEMTLSEIGVFFEELNDCHGAFRLAKSYDELMKNKAEGVVSFMLSVEGLDCISQNELLLPVLFELGVRFFGLTWSRRNYLGEGVTISNEKKDGKNGLTQFGFRVLKILEELGGVVDLSHLNDEGARDVLNNFGGKIMLSHSNNREVFDISRNAPKDIMEMVKNRGGICGVNSTNTLVAPCDELATKQTLATHALKDAEFFGDNFPSMGFDFYENVTDYIPSTNHFRKTFDVVKGYDDVKNFVAALYDAGASDALVANILGKNFLNFYR